MSKTPNERQSRNGLIGWARQYGCEAELLKIFSRYDELIKNCKSEEEKSAIAAMGILEIDKFFGGQGDLTINGNDYSKSNKIKE